MAHGLNLDLGAGQAAASSIKAIVGDMRGVIGRIKTSAASGMGDWVGKAASSFDATHTDWHATAVNLEHALDDIERKLTTGFLGYEDQDTDAGNTIVSAAAGGLNL
ncbi:WXG100 family type VII secretion target [Gordonia sp. PP30]|uniref:WXG100 family type VII secretion target n=1 Tax=unclassified Gordonia (in: high G+C Gram-positive bacteria) TaxID=2657482 RepID=UPI001FFE9763|nr:MULTISPECIES: WXG100 family type VII secretion target [unclassified Gordonia (in: high G+C Gram-positive bacteria)]UQE74356.1 WXG100 family type VII secretion target [Gordonia sp. PP30]